MTTPKMGAPKSSAPTRNKRLVFMTTPSLNEAVVEDATFKNLHVSTLLHLMLVDRYQAARLAPPAQAEETK